MAERENDRAYTLGDPLAQPLPEDGSPMTTATTADAGLREGDSGLGLPDLEPQGVRELSPQESEAWLREREAALRARLEQDLAAFGGTTGRLVVPPALRAFSTHALLLIAALLGLLVVGQVTSALSNLAALPPAAQWVAGGALLLCATVVLYVAVRVVGLYLSLRRNRQVQLAALAILAERRRFQLLAETHVAEARSMLKKYLEEYPLDGKQAEALQAAGLSAGELETLRVQRQRLSDPGLATADSQWLADFVAHFQAVLDRAAVRRVNTYAVKSGLATAASPNALLDQLVILYACASMIGDLLRLYHVRPAFGATAVILAQAVVHAYLAGELGELTEDAADATGDQLAELTGSSGLEILGTNLLSMVGAKVTEGGLNALLIRRLGRRVVLLLQPVRHR